MINQFLLVLLFVVLIVYGKNLLGANEEQINDDARIHGGENATSPIRFMVGIFISDQELKCAGSLIARRTVLTAGQCCMRTDNIRLPSDYINIVIGKVKFNEMYGSIHYQIHPASQQGNIYIHPNYNYKNKDYDFCIAHLPRDLYDQDARAVQYIKIADETPETGTEVTVAGWGKYTNDKGDDPIFPNPQHTDLKYLSMDILDAKMCKRRFSQLAYTDENYLISNKTMICATNINGSACGRDNGGPLFTGWGRDAELVGIFSRPRLNFEGGLCQYESVRKPDVFADPTQPEIRKWIKDHTYRGRPQMRKVVDLQK